MSKPGLENLMPQTSSSADKNQERFPYNSQTSELLYYGTKIFYEAIKDDVNNKTEILTMNGVEIMNDIVNFILSKAKQSTAEDDIKLPNFRRSKAMSDI